jgi:hypothetical protein
MGRRPTCVCGNNDWDKVAEGLPEASRPRNGDTMAINPHRVGGTPR